MVVGRVCRGGATTDLCSFKEASTGMHMTNQIDKTPLRKGQRFHEFLAQINPATGKTYTIKEGAAALGVEYATFRNLEALWRSPGDGSEQIVQSDEILRINPTLLQNL